MLAHMYIIFSQYIALIGETWGKSPILDAVLTPSIFICINRSNKERDENSSRINTVTMIPKFAIAQFLCSSSSRNTHPLLPSPPQIIIPLPLLQRLMHTFHIRLTLLSSCYGCGSPGLLCCDKGLAGASVFVGRDVFGSDVQCCCGTSKHLFFLFLFFSVCKINFVVGYICEMLAALEL
jgi:hypothetical protein